ncbi:MULTISPECIES: hypothetical protein [Haloarcula]|uniref:hypothetical protein n=1 Tax=Haloarcula TaxID=2237 RepID=UPI0023EAFED6|nr:hypothetical protein [Halomicroarcula sp. XH51]
MGLFSSEPAARVCGIAIDDYGLRISTMSCEDRTLSSPADGEFVGMLDGPATARARGIDETLTALAGRTVPLLEAEDRDAMGRSASARDGYADRLAELFDEIDDDGWDGETVVAMPPDYADSSALELQGVVEDSGFDVRQVVTHDAASSVLGAVDHEINTDASGSHPIVTVDLGLRAVTVTLASVNLDEGRVRVRARDSVDAGLVDLLGHTAVNAIEDSRLTPDEVTLEMETGLYPAIRQIFDPYTDSARGEIEVGGETMPVTVSTEHFIGLFADVASFAEMAATEFVVEAGYVPREVDRVLISGLGSEGDSGGDLTAQIAARFTSEDSMAAEVGAGYAPESVYYGNEMMPDVGAADVAREAHALGRDLDMLETLDVEAT